MGLGQSTENHDQKSWLGLWAPSLSCAGWGGAAQLSRVLLWSKMQTSLWEEKSLSPCSHLPGMVSLSPSCWAAAGCSLLTRWQCRTWVFLADLAWLEGYYSLPSSGWNVCFIPWWDSAALSQSGSVLGWFLKEHQRLGCGLGVLVLLFVLVGLDFGGAGGFWLVCLFVVVVVCIHFWSVQHEHKWSWYFIPSVTIYKSIHQTWTKDKLTNVSIWK